MSGAEIGIEILRVLGNWPVLAAAVVVFVVRTFEKEIKHVLYKRSFKWRDFELGDQQLADEAATAKPGSEQAAATTDRESAQPVPPSNTDPAPDTIDKDEALAMVKAERERATHWEYRYLAHYLARPTHELLDWLILRNEPVSIGLIDGNFSQTGIEVGERVARVRALQSHHLIDLRDGFVRVTEKGHEFRKWRGDLPAVQGSPPHSVGRMGDITTSKPGAFWDAYAAVKRKDAAGGE